MKYVVAIALLLLVTVPASGHPPSPVPPFDYTGNYLPSALPRSLRNVEALAILSSRAGTSPTVEVLLLARDRARRGVHKSVQAKIRDLRVHFETDAVGGESYSFDGRFVMTKHEREQGHFDESGGPGSVPCLTGSLTRYQGGKRMATAKVSFMFTNGG
jgi:uncharacterized protein (DUF58 family)